MFYFGKNFIMFKLNQAKNIILMSAAVFASVFFLMFTAVVF